jgi:hypothetical protein
MCSPGGNRPRQVRTSTEPQFGGRERRELPARRALEDRVRGEFLEMHGVSLNVAEAARLMGVPQPICGRLLRALVREGSLRQNLDGRYMVADVQP